MHFWGTSFDEDDLLRVLCLSVFPVRVSPCHEEVDAWPEIAGVVDTGFEGSDLAAGWVE